VQYAKLRIKEIPLTVRLERLTRRQRSNRPELKAQNSCTPTPRHLNLTFRARGQRLDWASSTRYAGAIQTWRSTPTLHHSITPSLHHSARPDSSTRTRTRTMRLV